MQFAHSSKGYAFPETVGGASNAGGCDYFYTPTGGSGWSAVGWYGALFGGYATHGAYAGFGSLNANYRSSHSPAYLGFRLCRF